MIRNSANLHTNIGTTIPRIVELLSDNNWGVRQVCINALSKFVEHGELVYCVM